jgi:RimJ/RimL family protein N-acetyltransferase
MNLCMRSSVSSVRAPAMRVAGVSLEPVTPDAYPFLYQLATAEETGYLWRFRGATPTNEMFRNSLEHGVSAHYVLVDRRGQGVGYVMAIDVDPVGGVGNVGVIAEPRAWSTGLGLIGFAMFVEYLFAVHPFRKLYADTVEYSYRRFASGADKYFVIEGVLRAHHYYDGRYWDKIILAITRERWREHGAPLVARLRDAPTWDVTDGRREQ